MKRPKTNSADLSDDETTGKRRSLAPLAALKPYILRYPLILSLAGVALVVSAGAMLVIPMAVRRMIDFGFVASDDALINQYFTMLIAIGTLLAVSSASRFYFVHWLGERVVADLRDDVFAHLSKVGPAFFETTHSGEVMSRLTADTTQIKAAAGSSLSQALRSSIMLVGAMIMMFVTSTELSTLVLVAIPAIVLPLMAYGRVVKRLSRKAQDSLAEASAYAAENLSEVRTMQAFAHEEAVSRRFAGAVEDAFNAAKDRLMARAGLTALAIALLTTSIVAILWYGASSVVSGEMTGGRLGQFVLYTVFAAGALAQLSEVWGELAQAAGASERLMELLDVVPQIRSPKSPVALPQPPRGDLSFSDVGFRYPSRPDVAALSEVSFTVEHGETVALVGPSGAGKSTIFNLLLRFYDPDSGVVSINSIPVDQVAIPDLRGRISVVPQDVALFADTIFENIRYGSPDASLPDVKKAAVAAQADAFIRELADGYQTRLGERGVTLSGGQRQRIAIARAILKDAPILLLDEATSALDAENELAVQKALEGVMKDRTTLVIAHRLATVQKADRILVMKEGRIVEEGDHNGLTAAGGLYSRLAKLQFAKEAAE